MKMNNNIYGLIGIGVKNANWNAEWDGLPKRNGEDIIKGSSYALQFCIKNQWNNEGKKAFGIKTIREDNTCNTLQQRYYDLFQEEDVSVKKAKDEEKINHVKEVRNNLLSCKDVLNFGIAYTGATSMSFRGVVQFTDGENKYEDTTIMTEKMLSPFASEEGNTMSTNGTKYITDEAHYVYDFSIFPKELDKYIDDNFKGYTEEDYEDFQKASLISVSNYNSKAKAGCKNEFAMFIKVKENENYQLDLNYLQDYVKVYKNDNNKIVYDLNTITELLNKVEDKIESIEVYYNYRTIELNITDIKKLDNIKIFDLITREEI